MPTLAAIQMCSSDNVDENLKTAGRLIGNTASHGAQLAILPEMFAIVEERTKNKPFAQEPYGKGKIQTFLSEQAAKYNVWIVGGTIPISCDNNDKVRAACLVFDNTGKRVARYDKIHLFDVTVSDTESYKESSAIEPGSNIVVIDTPVGKLGLSVCYDIRFPGLFTQLLNQGAEIIAIPAAFTIKTGEAHWKVLTRSRAIENLSYVVGACQGGTHNTGRKTYGHTLIVEPWGTVIEEITEPGTAIAYANIDLKKLHQMRAAIPIEKHQRIKPDLSLLKGD